MHEDFKEINIELKLGDGKDNEVPFGDEFGFCRSGLVGLIGVFVTNNVWR
ncbi:hypothetical protein ACVWYG_000911 [Pedobacter sp. UYEF25]